MNVDVVVGVCPCVFDIGLEFDVVHDLDVDGMVWFLGVAIVDVVVCVDGHVLVVVDVDVQSGVDVNVGVDNRFTSLLMLLLVFVLMLMLLLMLVLTVVLMCILM